MTARGGDAPDVTSERARVVGLGSAWKPCQLSCAAAGAQNDSSEEESSAGYPLQHFTLRPTCWKTVLLRISHSRQWRPDRHSVGDLATPGISGNTSRSEVWVGGPARSPGDGCRWTARENLKRPTDGSQVNNM